MEFLQCDCQANKQFEIKSIHHTNETNDKQQQKKVRRE